MESAMNPNNEIRFAGFGGQGIIMAGYIVGKAAAIYDNKYSTLIQSFGPEARGSACSAQILISNEPILYPYITIPNIVVALSRDAYDTYSHQITKGGILLIEKDLVQIKENTKDITIYAIPATRLAEEMGRKIVMNIITVGFFAATTGVTTYEATRKAVETSVPAGTEELNLKAFDTGYNYGIELLKPKKKLVMG